MARVDWGAKLEQDSMGFVRFVTGEVSRMLGPIRADSTTGAAPATHPHPSCQAETK